MCLDTDDVWRPAKKSTSILTTKQVQNAMTLQCQGDHQHCNLEGHMPGMGPHTKYMEDYQPELASTLAAAISLDEPPQQWESGYASTLSEKLHRNLGHPAPKELEELLAARGASDQVLEAARTYTKQPPKLS